MFLENTSCANSIVKRIDPIEYSLAFKGIQSIPGNISKPQRNEIFNRVLRILTLQQLPPNETTTVDCINLLTFSIEHISHPYILLNANLLDFDESNREGSKNDPVPLITLANTLDFSQGTEFTLTASRALKLLTKMTIK